MLRLPTVRTQFPDPADVAGFPRAKSLRALDFDANPAIDPAVINTLATCDWVRNTKTINSRTRHTGFALRWASAAELRHDRGPDLSVCCLKTGMRPIRRAQSHNKNTPGPWIYLRACTIVIWPITICLRNSTTGL
jgi:hypothetical protein